ncbi:MAG: branched-chain amino acid ABC transporter substrate-binding protein [Chloroflexota bacterium]
MKLTKVGAIAGIAVIALSACGGGNAAKGTVKIAIDLPLQGSELAASQPIINGVKLAIKDAGGKAGGYTVELPQSAIFDDAINGAHDPQTGAANATKIAGDDTIIGVVGPLNSSVGKAMIPITNEAGVLQCSPANTNPDLTKGDPAKQLRTKANNYIRVTTTDDVQGPAASQYIYDVLGKKSVYIIDDTETFGKGVADAFEADFKQRGGTVVKHDAAPKTTQDYVSIMTAAKGLNPESIYFGGVTATGGARILLAAQQVGLGDIPYVGPDGINDGSGATKDSFLNLAGDAAKNAYSTLAGIGDFPGKADFDAKYLKEYGIAATGYAGMGYACTQVVLDALTRAAAGNPADNAALREAVRAAGTATDRTYKTILGDISFDAGGDTSQRIVSIYAVKDADWSFLTQVDYK